MKFRMMLCLAVPLLFSGALAAGDKDVSAKNVSEKNITILSATTSADGSTAIHTELLEECIETLPDAASLMPTVHAETKHMQEINGDPGRSEFAQNWTAELEIAYMLHQKAMIVIATNSIKGTEPTTQVVDKRIPKTMKFVSDPGNGDSYANRSSRIYYFSTAAKASEDVIRQAAAWIHLQSPVTCK